MLMTQDVSVMKDNIQSLPQDLRTNPPKRWSTEDVCAWMTGWGSTFISATTTREMSPPPNTRNVFTSCGEGQPTCAVLDRCDG